MSLENVRLEYHHKAIYNHAEMFVILFAELGQLSGVAAILRFPLPQLDEDSDDSDTGD